MSDSTHDSDRLGQRLDAILPRVTQPGQYIGSEWNTGPTDSDDLPTAVVLFPDVYARGLHDSTFQTVYQALRARSDLSVDRAFVPLADMRSALAGAGIPWVTLDRKLPLASADWLVFVLADPLTFPEVAGLLALADLPVRSAERNAGHPGTIGLGPGVPAAGSLGEILDAMLAGEPEDAIAPLFDHLLAGRGSPGTALLESVFEPGVPSAPDEHPRPVTLAIARDLDRCFAMTNPVPGWIQTHDERIHVDVQRGGQRDPECDPPSDRFPELRNRSAERTLQIASEAYRSSGIGRIHLAGTAHAPCPGLEGVVRRLADEHRTNRTRITLDPLPAVDHVTGLIRELGRTDRAAWTLALDAGSESLREEIGRGTPNRRILDLIDESAVAGISKVEVHIPIGHPAESDPDLLAAVGLAKDLLQQPRGGFAPTKVHVRFEAFEPLPFTEADRSGMIEPEAARAAFERVRSLLGPDGAKVSYASPEKAMLRTAIARAETSARWTEALVAIGTGPAGPDAGAEERRDAIARELARASIDAPGLATRTYAIAGAAPFDRFSWPTADVRPTTRIEAVTPTAPRAASS